MGTYFMMGGLVLLAVLMTVAVAWAFRQGVRSQQLKDAAASLTKQQEVDDAKQKMEDMARGRRADPDGWLRSKPDD